MGVLGNGVHAKKEAIAAAAAFLFGSTLTSATVHSPLGDRLPKR